MNTYRAECKAEIRFFVDLKANNNVEVSTKIREQFLYALSNAEGTLKKTIEENNIGLEVWGLNANGNVIKIAQVEQKEVVKQGDIDNLLDKSLESRK